MALVDTGTESCLLQLATVAKQAKPKRPKDFFYKIVRCVFTKIEWVYHIIQAF